MKTLLIILGLMTATAMVISSSLILDNNTAATFHAFANSISPEFKWTQVAPPGSGTHQYEWKPGTYPSAIIPLVGNNNELWMIGQKKAWSSNDGLRWQSHEKVDWGERISMAYVFFNKRFWALGGMEYSTNKFLNEIWSSSDGKNWTRTVEHAEWSPRKGHSVIVFDNKLWLFGGAISVHKDRSPNELVNDIWSSTDGIHWVKVSDSSPWTARNNVTVLAFKNKLWMVGGQGNSDSWNTVDGKNWTRIKTDAPWKDRYDYGALVFDNLLWIYGGRDIEPRNAYKDVWFSIDGVQWRLQTENAPWTPRSGVNSVVFKNKLWLYGGKHTGHQDSFSGDIWTMEPI